VAVEVVVVIIDKATVAEVGVAFQEHFIDELFLGFEVGIVELCLESGARKIVYDKVFNPGMDAQAIENSWICKSGYMTPEAIVNGAKFEDEKDVIQQIVNEYENGIHSERSWAVQFPDFALWLLKISK